MVLYQCDKCNFETNDKGKYNRHCNRKFPCNKNYKTKSIQSDKIIPQFSLTDQDENRQEIERHFKMYRGLGPRRMPVQRKPDGEDLPDNQLLLGYSAMV